MYAIVRAGGRQEKVALGDVLEIDRLHQEPGASVQLPVLLLVNGTDVTSDKSSLAEASVTVEVVATTKGPKIDILKFKNKTGYRRRMGHRQRHTRVRVTGIDNGSGTSETLPAGVTSSPEPSTSATKTTKSATTKTSARNTSASKTGAKTAATKTAATKTAATKSATTKTAATKTAAPKTAAPTQSAAAQRTTTEDGQPTPGE